MIRQDVPVRVFPEVPPMPMPAEVCEVPLLLPVIPMRLPQAADEPMQANATANDEIRNSEMLYVMEICAGSANLSAAMQKVGFVAVAIDHKLNKHKPRIKCVDADLSSPKGQKLIEDMRRTKAFFLTSMSPPCGTASAARSIPIPWKDRTLGAPQPKPLRSKQFPLGLPKLEGKNRLRVWLANEIYFWCLRIAKDCIREGTFFMIENPRSSWLWEIPEFAALIKTSGIFIVDFQVCAHGGKRPKWTRFVTNCEALCELARECPRDHEHEKWGAIRPAGNSTSWSFSTEQEAEFPTELCSKFARIAHDEAGRRGYKRYCLEDQPSLSDLPAGKKARVSTMQNQQRIKHIPQLIPEYGEIKTIALPQGCRAVPGESSDKLIAGKQCKILRILEKRGESKADETKAVVGVYLSAEEFTAKALSTEHPIDLSSGVRDEIVEAVYFILSHSTCETMRHRLEQVKMLRELLKDTQEENDKLMASLDPRVSKVLAGKNLVAFRKLLDLAGHPDKRLVDDMAAGMKLVGAQPSSGVFLDGFAPAADIETNLLLKAGLIQQAILGTIKSSGKTSVDEEVWKQTQEEEEQGWLIPISRDDLNKLYPEGWVPCRRFGLEQSDKIRTIDDLSEPGTNSCYGVSEKLDLMDTSEICAVIRMLANAVRDDGTFVLQKLDGKFIDGKLGKGWTVTAAKLWLGRTLDLKKAYRQLATFPEHMRYSVVAVHKPGCCEPQLFLAPALLFGPTGSVYAFNRATRGLWRIGCRLFKICWLNFYDDFPMFEPMISSESARATAHTFLFQLGWRCALEAKKNVPFHELFNALGVTFQLNSLLSGAAFVTNKENRIDDVQYQVDCIKARGKIKKSEAASIGGKLRYAEAQCFGRIAREALCCLDSVSSAGANQREAADIFEAIDWLLRKLRCSGPRPIVPDPCLQKVFVFTDAASEGSLHTVGGVMFDEASRSVEYFGCRIDPKLVAEWFEDGREKIINIAELYAVWLARHKWAARLAHRKVFIYIDSNAAKGAILAGHTTPAAANWIVRSLILLEFEQAAWTWYARVPSTSNIADEPSRLDDVDLLRSFPGAKFVNVIQPTTFRDFDSRSHR